VTDGARALVKGAALRLFLTATVVLAACDSSDDIPPVRGHVLQLSAAAFQRVDEVAYDAEGTVYAVRPASAGDVLLLARLSVLNRNASLASLLVDEQALAVEDTTGVRHPLVNPWTQRERTATPPEKTGDFTPLLWGPTELMENYGISGWVIFELPKGAKVRTLLWNQVEEIRLYFPDKPV
jgi:hypothetical protein